MKRPILNDMYEKSSENKMLFRFQIDQSESTAEVLNLFPEARIKENMGDLWIYSKSYTFRDILQSARISIIEPLSDYVDFQVLSGVNCRSCLESIGSRITKHFDFASEEVFAFFDEQSKRVEVFLSRLEGSLDRTKLREALSPKFKISYFYYFDIEPIHCGNCIASIFEVLDADSSFDSHSILDKRYLVIENVDIIDVNEIVEKVSSTGKKCKQIPYIPSSPIERVGVVSVVDDESLLYPLEEVISIKEEREDMESSGGLTIIERPNREEYVALEEEEGTKKTVQKLVISIDGMTCGSCGVKVTKYLLGVRGVLSADVSLLSTKGYLEYDESHVTEEEILSKLSRLGYPSQKVVEITSEGEIVLVGLKLKSLEVSAIKSFFSSVEDLELVKYSRRRFGGNKTESLFHVAFRDDKQRWTPRRLLNHVLDEFGVELYLDKGPLKVLETTLLKKKEIRYYVLMFVLSFLFTAPAAIFALVFGNIHRFGMPAAEYKGTGIYFSLWRGIDVKVIVLFLLVTPVVFICGFSFYKKAVQVLLFSRTLDKNALITVSTWTAYLVSIASVVYSMFDPKYVGSNYMEGSAMLITFLLLGQVLENLASRKTSSSIVKLLKLQPDQALLIDFDDNLEVDDTNYLTLTEKLQVLEDPDRGFIHGVRFEKKRVSVNLLWPGDIVQVKIGEKIPSDGKVLVGESDVNQGMITGESAYVRVSPSGISDVIGGTVNISHPLIIQITKSTQNNMLSRIVKMVEDAQMNKPRIQDTLDRVSLFFVPAVCAISFGVLLLWLALTLSGAVPHSWMDINPVIFSVMQTTSTLIVACPCALGLAVPLVIMVSNGIGAKYGVIFKGGLSFENLNRSKVVCFDKTGTLTKGVMSVDSHVSMAENDLYDMDSLLLYIAGAEAAISSHPIAQCIIDYVFSKVPQNTHSSRYKPLRFEHVNGQGIKAEIRNVIKNTDHKGKNTLLIGNLRLLENEGVENIDREKIKLICEEKTRVFVAVDGILVSIFLLGDPLKPEIKGVIKQIRKMGKRVVMITGDNDEVATRIGMGELGMSRDDIMSGMTPMGKADYIKNLQNYEKKIVVFVGDGVNDSVALSQADVGISMKSGTEIAMECSQVVLMKPSMMGLLFSFHLAKHAYRRIKLNIFWAFVYNVFAIPIAAGVLFPIPGLRMVFPPWVSAILMTISSLSVTLNTVLFRIFYRPEKKLRKHLL